MPINCTRCQNTGFIIGLVIIQALTYQYVIAAVMVKIGMVLQVNITTEKIRKDSVVHIPITAVCVSATEVICHMCESSTDFNCRDCKEPVCYDCCVAQTIHNQIDYALCKSCEMGYESARSEEAHKEWLLAEEKRIWRKAVNAKRKDTYWKPENVEKRRIAKLERKRAAIEHRRKMFAESVALVNSMFKGM